MLLTRAADYGVRVMVHLAGQAPGTRASLTRLAAAAEAPPAFLSKVLQQLVRTGYVCSHRGKGGGFELVPQARTVSVLDIVDALGGLPHLSDRASAAGRPARGWSGADVVWREAELRMREELAKASLDSLVAGHDRGTPAGSAPETRPD